MKLALGIKQGMTQVFDGEGNIFPATIIVAGPMTVTHVKTLEKDGYNSIQLGFTEAKEKHVTKAGNEIPLAEIFKVGDVVEVSGISKGKGFQGVVKRHGFKGGRRSHGQKHSEREAGSIGGGGRAGGRVVKGMRMAGRMGGERITVKSLKVIKMIQESGEIYISGAIPGRRGSKVEIKLT